MFQRHESEYPHVGRIDPFAKYGRIESMARPKTPLNDSSRAGWTIDSEEIEASRQYAVSDVGPRQHIGLTNGKLGLYVKLE